MDKTRRSSAEDRVLEFLEKVEGGLVAGVRRIVETVDAWWPEATTSRFTEVIPSYVDRGVHLAEQELDHEYKFAKRVIKNQRAFLKNVAHAMTPHTPAHPARKTPAKTAA